MEKENVLKIVKALLFKEEQVWLYKMNPVKPLRFFAFHSEPNVVRVALELEFDYSTIEDVPPGKRQKFTWESIRQPNGFF